MSNTVTLAGNKEPIAPLKPLQVAAFFDEMNVARNGEPRLATFTRSLRIIYQGLKNADNPLVKDLDEAQGIAAVNDVTSYDEVTPAFRTVMDITGLNTPQANSGPETESQPESVEQVA